MKGRVAAVIVPVSKDTADLLYELAEEQGAPATNIVRSALLDYLAKHARHLMPPPPVYEWMTR